MKMKTKKQKLTAAFFALVFAQILWGVNLPVIKLGLQTISVPVFLSVTIIGAGLLSAPLAYKYWRPIKLKDHILIIISSLIAISLGNILLLMGFERVPSVNAALISLLEPLLLFALSVQFLKERLSLRTFLGIVIGFVGAAIIIGKPWDASGASQQMVTGSLLIVLAVFCDVIATLIFKPILKRVHPYQLTSLHLLWGIVPIAIYSIPHLSALAPERAGSNGYWAIFFNIILITIANCLFLYGLMIKKAQEVGVFTYLHPIAAAIGGWFILSEVPSGKVIAGGALIFLGIYYAEIKKPRSIY
jgi:drug/metabolite transporter (DMT)-like permease